MENGEYWIEYTKNKTLGSGKQNRSGKLNNPPT